MTIRDGYLLIMLGGGLVAPIIYFLNILWAAAVYPGYRHPSQFISELGTRISPGARYFNRWLSVTGTMLVVFAFGVYVSLGSQREALGILLGLVLFGLTVVIMAVFPCDSGCPRTPQSRAGMVHGFFWCLGRACGSDFRCTVLFRLAADTPDIRHIFFYHSSYEHHLSGHFNAGANIGLARDMAANLCGRSIQLGTGAKRADLDIGQEPISISLR